jgi:hypothetical protein
MAIGITAESAQGRSEFLRQVGASDRQVALNDHTNAVVPEGLATRHARIHQRSDHSALDAGRQVSGQASHRDPSVGTFNVATQPEPRAPGVPLGSATHAKPRL